MRLSSFIFFYIFFSFLIFLFLLNKFSAAKYIPVHYVNYDLSVPYFCFIFTSHLQYKLNFSVFKTSFCDILLSFPLFCSGKQNHLSAFTFAKFLLLNFYNRNFSLKTHRLFSVQTVHNFLPVQSFPYKHFQYIRFLIYLCPFPNKYTGFSQCCYNPHQSVPEPRPIPKAQCCVPVLPWKLPDKRGLISASSKQRTTEISCHNNSMAIIDAAFHNNVKESVFLLSPAALHRSLNLLKARILSQYIGITIMPCIPVFLFYFINI